jgi:hypothetical protein
MLRHGRAGYLAPRAARSGRGVSYLTQFPTPNVSWTVIPGEGVRMIRLPKKWLIYAAFLAVLLVLAGIGVTAAKALWPAAAVHPANGDSNRVFDADYVQGLVKQGIAKPPGL